MDSCLVDDCPRPIFVKSRQLCRAHYQRWWEHGDPNYKSKWVPAEYTPEQRLEFFGWTIAESGCWEWNGRLNKDGYGVLKIKNKTVRAYRVAYEVWTGPIPDGLIVRHTCDNRLCINPAHLLTGTPSDNRQDAVARGRARGGSRFSEETIAEAKALYRSGGYTKRRIEQQFGMSGGSMTRIMSGEFWKRVP